MGEELGVAVAETTRTAAPDPAPLWLPRHGQRAVDYASIQPPDRIEGYGWRSRFAATVVGSRRHTAARVGALVAFLVFLVSLPVLAGAGVAGMVTIAFHQAWTLLALLVLTWRVRSISMPTIAIHWFAGAFGSVLLVWLATAIGGNGLTSPVAEIAKAAPLIATVVVGRAMWRHPGVSDLAILGFAVGGGYAMHEDALWGRVGTSGVEPNLGFFVPTIFQDGAFFIGHAASTAIVGVAIGLLVLHRRNAYAVTGAVAGLLIVIGDHLVNNADGELGWIRDLTFGGKLPILVFLAAIAAAVVLDERRLREVARRDHLFPSNRQFLASDENGDPDFFSTTLVGRYRRMRNGVHNTVAATATQWPALSERGDAPVAELAMRARAAKIAVGPGTTPTGWANDPDDADRQRYVGHNGWTVYVSSDDGLSSSTPKQRPEATGYDVESVPDTYAKQVALVTLGVVAVCALRLATAGEPSADELSAVVAGFPDAPDGPPMIRTIVGGLAVALALRGVDRPELAESASFGPEDETPPPPQIDCEA